MWYYPCVIIHVVLPMCYYPCGIMCVIIHVVLPMCYYPSGITHVLLSMWYYPCVFSAADDEVWGLGLTHHQSGCLMAPTTRIDTITVCPAEHQSAVTSAGGGGGCVPRPSAPPTGVVRPAGHHPHTHPLRLPTSA